jgi:hypothetical protein
MSFKQLSFFAARRFLDAFFISLQKSMALVTTSFNISQPKQTLSPILVDLIIASLTTTQYLQANVLNGVTVNQGIMLVNGIMQDASLMIVCSISRHLFVSKLTGSYQTWPTGVGNATITSQATGTRFLLVIFGRFLSAKSNFA